MKKEKHIKIWKEIIDSTNKHLQLFSKEFGFSKPKKKRFRDEISICCENSKFVIIATILDGEMIPPSFTIIDKKTFHKMEINSLDKSGDLYRIKESGYTSKELYFERIKELMKDHFGK